MATSVGERKSAINSTWNSEEQYFRTTLSSGEEVQGDLFIAEEWGIEPPILVTFIQKLALIRFDIEKAKQSHCNIEKERDFFKRQSKRNGENGSPELEGKIRKLELQVEQMRKALETCRAEMDAAEQGKNSASAAFYKAKEQREGAGNHAKTSLNKKDQFLMPNKTRTEALYSKAQEKHRQAEMALSDSESRLNQMKKKREKPSEGEEFLIHLAVADRKWEESNKALLKLQSSFVATIEQFVVQNIPKEIQANVRLTLHRAYNI